MSVNSDDFVKLEHSTADYFASDLLALCRFVQARANDDDYGLEAPVSAVTALFSARPDGDELLGKLADLIEAIRDNNTMRDTFPRE